MESSFHNHARCPACQLWLASDRANVYTASNARRCAAGLPPEVHVSFADLLLLHQVWCALADAQFLSVWRCRLSLKTLAFNPYVVAQLLSSLCST